MPDTTLEEATKAIEQLNKDWHQFKSTNDEHLKAKAEGKAVSEIKAQLEKLEKSIQASNEVVERVARMEAAVKRGLGSGERKTKDGKELPEDWDAAVKSFDAFLRKGGDNGAKQAWSYDQKSMSVYSDPDGGYLVTADMSGRVIEKVYETSPIRNVASVQTIGTDALEGTYDGDEAAAEWVSETGTRSNTGTPQLGKWRIAVHEISAKPQVTQQLLEDANIDVEAWLARKVADKFARTQNAAFVNGNGRGKPRGFLTYDHGTTRGTIEQIASGVSAGLAADKFYNLIQALKGPYRTRARFAMNRTVLALVRQLKDGENRYLWEPSWVAGTPSRLLGYEVEEFNDMPDAAANSLSIAFADWAEAYTIVDRRGIRVLRDPYTADPFVKFGFTARVGGDVLNHEAIKLMKLG